MRKICCFLLAAAITAGCATQPQKSEQPQSSEQLRNTGKADKQEQAASEANRNSAALEATPLGAQAFYPSTYKVPPSPPTLIRHATVLTGTGTRLDGADVLLVDGKIQAVGGRLQAPPTARIIDGAGLWVTPGLIDIHSHLGVYPSPAVEANSDGNEATAPSTANVWAEHSVWPQDPGFRTALAGGITTLQILPGSANLIGGRSVVLKNVPSVTYQGMKFPGAPQGLKMACGENPKRVYGEEKHEAPSTRMGNVAGYRAQWAEAQEYLRDLEEYQQKVVTGAKDAKPPKRDLRLDTLAAALKGDIIVHMHCYRADEMATVLDMSREFGYHVAAFHHAVEAYKIADLLAEHGVCAAMWADWWGFKMEAYDGVPENIAFVDAAPGGCAIVHSDSEEGIQRLNQEAAKAIAYGARAGFNIPPERAIRWLTANAAKVLGILDRTGTLEPGKMADVVVWNHNPFSVYACANLVFIDGVVRYDRQDPTVAPESDFLVGQPASPAPATPSQPDRPDSQAPVTATTQRGALLPERLTAANTDARAGGRPSTAQRDAQVASAAALPWATTPTPWAQSRAVLIRNATIHTMTAAGTLEHADLLINHGAIAAIGTSLTAPTGAEIIDAGGRPVTPGLFGGLGHLGLEEIGLEPTADDYALKLGTMRPEFDVDLAFNPESAILGVNRLGGVTFAMLAPSAEAGGKGGIGGTIIAGQGSMARLDGTLAPTARALFIDIGGDASALSGGSRAAQFMLLQQAFTEVRSPKSLLPGDARLLTPGGRQALVTYFDGHAPIVFDADRASDIRQVIGFAQGEKLRVVIKGGTEAWRVARELAVARIPVILNPLDNLPASFDAVGATLENAARLNSAGVKIAFSFDDPQPHNIRKLRQAAGNAVAHGLPWDAALAALTRNPAEIFGVTSGNGTLERGHPADLVLWSGDPLEVTSLADRVFIEGEAQLMRSRQTELRDRYLQKLRANAAR